MNKLLYQDVTRSIIGAALEVHGVLGPGFLETVYEAALAHEFALRTITHRQQQHLEVLYKDHCVGHYIPDFIVANCVIVELKATKGITGIDEAQIINYLKATNYRVGLVINFGRSSLQFQRRVV